MINVGTQRPGVYSDYEASSVLWGNSSGKTVGLIAKSSETAGTLYNISRSSDAESIFGADELICKLCKTILENGAIKVIAISAGTDDYDSAFTTLESVSDICAVVCDSENTSIHNKLKTSVEKSSNNKKERIGIVSYPASSYSSSLASNFNSERIVVIAQTPLDPSGNSLSSCFLAAAFAGVVARLSDPSSSFNGSILKGIYGLSSLLSEDDIDNYIEAGITPLETISGKTEIIRAVTSKTSTSGVTDLTFKEVNTILILDYVISNIRNNLSNMLQNSKNNSSTRNAISTQVSIALEQFRESNIINSFSQPVVYEDEDDQSICVVEVSFEISKGINQIYITASVRI